MTNVHGNAAFSFSYAAIDGEPLVTATATNVAGTTSEFSSPVEYAITAAGLTFAATATVPFDGMVASFTSSDSLATAADFEATIDYGDGTSSQGTVVAAPGGFVVVGSHTFATAGPDTAVTVTIADMLVFSQATANSLADVTSQGGWLTAVDQSVPFVAGTPASAVVASFTDSSPLAFANEFSAMINWNDGTPITRGIISAAGAGFNVTASHTYEVAGSSTFDVTITDALSGKSVTASSTAVVAPVPITIQPRNFAVTGGAVFFGEVATFTDGDPRTNPAFYSASINWGDGTTTTSLGSKPTVKITGINPFVVTGSHKYTTFQATDLLTITITDQNGRTATAVDRVVDPPAAPEPASPATLAIVADPLTLSRNKPFRGIVATFTDSGPPEPLTDYKATINWGKGRKSVGMITGSNGRFVVSARHAFGRFTVQQHVTVTVTDTEGQVVSVSETALYTPHRPRVIRVRSHAKLAATSQR